jgi:hypothetical protein
MRINAESRENPLSKQFAFALTTINAEAPSGVEA